MRDDHIKSVVENTRRLNKVSIGINLILAVTVIICVLVIASLSHKERTIIIPPNFSNKFTITDDTSDAKYLEQMAIYLLDEKLNISPDNVDANHHQLLKYVSSSDSVAMESGLLQEAKEIKKGHINGIFYPISVKTNPKDLSVFVKGKVKTYVGKRLVTDEDRSYLLKFTMNNGYLQLKSITNAKKGANNA